MRWIFSLLRVWIVPGCGLRYVSTLSLVDETGRRVELFLTDADGSHRHLLPHARHLPA